MARRRAPLLAAAGWNLNRLPADAFTADLSTDAGCATAERSITGPAAVAAAEDDAPRATSPRSSFDPPTDSPTDPSADVQAEREPVAFDLPERGVDEPIGPDGLMGQVGQVGQVGRVGSRRSPTRRLASVEADRDDPATDRPGAPWRRFDAGSAPRAGGHETVGAESTQNLRQGAPPRSVAESSRWAGDEPGKHTPSASATSLGAAVAHVFGPCAWLLTASGRGAESVVASLVRPGQQVLANEVYVSGRWWIERFGGTVAPLPDPAAPPPRPGTVAYVQLTAPPACLAPGAGRPVPIERFRAARAWIDRCAPDLPLVVDASRLWENAAALSGSAHPDATAREVIALADVLVLSAGKDLGAPGGGLVIVRSSAWWPRLADAAARLEPAAGAVRTDEQASIARGLVNVAAGSAGPRWRALDELAHGLIDREVPVHSWGAGSIFLDPAAWIPEVPADELRAQVLLDVIWLVTGWRGLGSTTDDVGAPLVRLAMRDQGPALLAQLPGLVALAATLRRGLRPVPRDRAARYLQPATPVDPADWPVSAVAPPPSAHPTRTGPAPDDRSPAGAPPAGNAPAGNAPAGGWLVARCRAGAGPQRALADAWTRTFPGAELPDQDPTLRSLLDLLPAPSAPSASSASPTEPQMGAGTPAAAPVPSAVARLDGPGAWPAGAPDSVDVCWASTAQGGLVAVRAGSPLAGPLDAASLFTLGTWFAPEPG